VILSVRDAGEWYDSAAHTIFKKPEPRSFFLLKVLAKISKRWSYVLQVYNHIDTFLFQGAFEGKVHDKKAMIAKFNEWNEKVKATVPADRLLVYDIKQGWEPLCTFLNIPVPEAPFPRTNSKDSFQKRVDKAISQS